MAGAGGLCDRCRNPGRCCSGFEINGGEFAINCTHPLEVLVMLATVNHLDPWMAETGLPFVPLFKRSDGHWMLWCPRLGMDGRCTEYEDRPRICRVFEAGADRLCAEWDGVPTPPAMPETPCQDAAPCYPEASHPT